MKNQDLTVESFKNAPSDAQRNEIVEVFIQPQEYMATVQVHP